MKTKILREIRKKHADIVRGKIEKREVAPIQGLSIMIADCKKELEEKKLYEEAKKILNLTIGDIDPTTFTIDEKDNLAEELGISPKGRIRNCINSIIETTREEFWKNHDPLTKYQISGNGILPLRKKYQSLLEDLGLLYSTEEIFISHGSSEGIFKLLAGINHLAKKKNITSEFLFSAPGFLEIKAQAEILNINIITAYADSQSVYCLTALQLKQVLKNSNNSLSVLYLIPMNNPTSTVYDPTILKELLESFLVLRPQGIILLDLAYIDMIAKEKAKSILSLFENENIKKQTVSVVSMSKMFGYPRIRSAALYTTNKLILEELQHIAHVVTASLSGPMELEAIAFWEAVPYETRLKLYELLQRRQQKLLERIDQINATRKNNGEKEIANLKQVYQEIPLYIYLQLAKGIDYIDFFVETGLGGVPGTVFGDKPENNMIRLAVGMEAL